MIPSIGSIVVFNPFFLRDVRNYSENHKKWIEGKNGEFLITKVEAGVKPDSKMVFYKSLDKSNPREYRIALHTDGHHRLSNISLEIVFLVQRKNSINKDDYCPDCNVLGQMVRMACICKKCGRVIWGC